MEKRFGSQLLYAISFATQLGFLIAVPIGAFMLLGAWIDKQASSGPLFVMLGALLGGWTSWHEIRRLLSPLMHRSDHDAEHHPST